jgi:hypothetical protein
MIRLKSFLLGLLFFFVGCDCVNAQSLTLRIDSIKFDGITSYIDSAFIFKNDTTIRVYCTFTNDSISPSINLQDSALSFKAVLDSVYTLDSLNFTYILPIETLAKGSSATAIFKIFNANGSPLPHFAPGGSSVVIWPVYFSNSYNSVKFTLFADTTRTGNNDLISLYNFVGYNHQSIYIQFSSTEQRTVELYDATGRKVYERQSSDPNEEIAWGDLPTGIFIIRIRQDQQSTALKLLHY